MEAVTPRTGLLSVVLPAYNEEESVPLAARTIGGLLAEADIPYELLFVNDGSRDHTWQAIQKAAEQDPRVGGHPAPGRPVSPGARGALLPEFRQRGRHLRRTGPGPGRVLRGPGL